MWLPTVAELLKVLREQMEFGPIGSALRRTTLSIGAKRRRKRSPHSRLEARKPLPYHEGGRWDELG
jgi:hypothetical protein